MHLKYYHKFILKSREENNDQIAILKMWRLKKETNLYINCYTLRKAILAREFLKL